MITNDGHIVGDLALLDLAIRCHQAGDLQQAEQLYRQILQADPVNVDALHLLGLIALHFGKLDPAIEHIRQALERKPDFAEAHYNLALALRQQGKLAEAMASWQQAIRYKPDYAEAHYHLGNALQQQDQLTEAMASWRQAVYYKPDYAEAHNNLGIALQQQGKLAESVASLQLALQYKPDFVHAHLSLGNTLLSQGKLDEAIAEYQYVVRCDPNSTLAYNNMGKAFQDQGRLDEAVASLRQALKIEPDFVEALNNLGLVLSGQGQTDEAMACLRRALQLKPDSFEADNHMGNIFKKHDNFEQAIACYRQALQIKPDYAEAYVNLGVAFQMQGFVGAALENCQEGVRLRPDLAIGHYNLGIVLAAQGRLDEALTCFRQSLYIDPDMTNAHDCLLYTMQYRQGVTLAELAECHAEYEHRHASPLRVGWKPHNLVRDPDKRLRLGLVSADFWVHPVGYFLIRVLENLDRGAMEIVCYSNRSMPDAMTARFQVAANLWRDVVGLNDAQLAEQIRADQIDILFDLGGHTLGNRLLVFARKPAPVQISWIGYEGTTGLTEIDYILADRHTIPVGSERYYVEEVLRMPHGYLCYDPPGTAPPVALAPATTRGFVTFCCFNNLAKITPQVIAVWSEILRRLPQSRLILKYKGLGDETVRDRYSALFAQCGVGSHQLDLRAQTSYADYLATYAEADIALDPFPFTGGTTTCEALWMGVPVITYPSETFASRHGLSHLSNVGIPETIASNLDDYVEIAVALAGDLPRLTALRAGLRQQMAASPLCDGKRFAEDLAALLRTVWHRYCTSD